MNGPDAPAFLGVTQSLTNRFWRGPTAEQNRAAEAIAQSNALSPLIAQVLARQNVAPQDVPDYLAPSIRDLMPDPMSLRDMGPAAERIDASVERGERVAIFADYDVDGGASAALLMDWMRQLGREPTLYVPDRLSEGYGPNVPAMAKLAADHDLIICVDCGTVSHEPIEAAKGADVIVIDHHLGGETLPPALAVVCRPAHRLQPRPRAPRPECRPAHRLQPRPRAPRPNHNGPPAAPRHCRPCG